jgi:Lrp/AsnC family transcriptional regulator, regulator for asnA, asnC and gidA
MKHLALRADRVIAGAPPGPASRGPVRRARRVDAVDKGIIEALQRNGREPFRRIAAGLGVSEATIRARYARLRDDNILQVTGVTNPLGLGFEAQAMVGIRTAGPPERVADEIARWDEADYVVVTAGQFDVLVELVCSDRRALLDVTNRIRALPDVVTTETFLYLELWKQLYDWGARVHEPPAKEAS